MWNELENSTPPALHIGTWSSESNIHSNVRSALKDVIKHSGLHSKLSLLHEVSIFHPVDKQQHRADIWVVRDQSGVPIGVCEVKKPSVRKNASNPLKHKMLHGQIFDYMLNLRNFFGLKRVFGFTTTYSEWRICWLPDCDQAAGEKDVNSYDEKAEDAQLVEVLDRKLHGTRIYRHDEPELVELLVHTLHKMARSPHDAAPKLLKPNQRYPHFKEMTWEWELLMKEPTFRLSYVMPPAQTRNFFLLQQYHRGADGIVWLAASASGHLVVLKFGVHGADRQEVKSLLQEEAERWNMLWLADSSEKVRVVTLFQRPALVMPFAFHAHVIDTNNDKDEQPDNDDDEPKPVAVHFKGPNSWTVALSDEEVAKRVVMSEQDLDIVSEDIKVLPELTKLVRELQPKGIARLALESMLAKGYMHADLEWRHVALLPTRNDNGWTLKPILIDLTRVRTVKDGHTGAELDTAMATLEQQLQD